MPDTSRIDELRRRLEAEPDSVVFGALAEEYRRAGMFEEAVEIARTGLTRHPNYLSAIVTLGRALTSLGDFKAAWEALIRVIKAAPDNVAAIHALADLYDASGKVTDRAAQGDTAAAKPSAAPPVRKEPRVAPSPPPPAPLPVSAVEPTPPLEIELPPEIQEIPAALAASSRSVFDPPAPMHESELLQTTAPEEVAPTPEPPSTWALDGTAPVDAQLQEWAETVDVAPPAPAPNTFSGSPAMEIELPPFVAPEPPTVAPPSPPVSTDESIGKVELGPSADTTPPLSPSLSGPSPLPVLEVELTPSLAAKAPEAALPPPIVSTVDPAPTEQVEAAPSANTTGPGTTAQSEYQINQIIQTPQGSYRVIGFDADGEPLVEAVETAGG